MWRVSFLASLGFLAFSDVVAQPAPFKHIIVVIQENRTPDNFFYGLCTLNACAVPPGAGQYNIQTSNWADKTAADGVRQPHPTPLSQNYDIGHAHSDFNTECDRTAGNNSPCKGDGFAGARCINGTCPDHPAYGYVSDPLMQPYYDLVHAYGWGNYFYQTNEGASWSSH